MCSRWVKMRIEASEQAKFFEVYTNFTKFINSKFHGSYTYLIKLNTNIILRKRYNNLQCINN